MAAINTIILSKNKNSNFINKNGDYYEDNTYDIFNQLIGQDVLISGMVYRRNYTYDTRGNIILYQYINLTDEDYITGSSFQYRTNGNKDELVSATINGHNYNITYSSTGQPSLYLGWQIEYDMRNITILENSQYYIQYSYNANNIRTGKYIDNGANNNDIAYILDGNKIIREIKTGDENYIINYFYDSSDNLIGFEYNNNKYLYLKNIQNDIIGIVDETGNLVVEYTYDAYGNIIKLVDTSNCDLSSINPFRYRSYYYDKETGWYYLNSRYYNPIICRFITMDSVEYLGAGGTNLFSYCNNNPVNNTDSNGTFKMPLKPGWTIFFGVLGIIFYLYTVCRIGVNLAKLTKSYLTVMLVMLIAYLSVSLGSQLLTYINGGFISAIMAAIVAFQGMMLALKTTTFGIYYVTEALLRGVGSIWFPKLIVSVNMLIDGIKGKSYIANISWFSASYKLA